jgi:glyoxylase-like metal-dependent hydrolase (beta-lactamase superfamily II)
MPIAHVILTSMPIVISGKTSRLPCTSLLVENGDYLMLFDTGTFDGADIVLALEKLGYSPDDITHIFNTHFHGDHAGGNRKFPHAIKIASSKEYDFARTWLKMFADARDKHRFLKGCFPYLDDTVIRDRGQLLVDHIELLPRYWWEGKMDGYAWFDDGFRLPPMITPLETPGHTPHHTSYVIEGEQTRIIIAGDALSQRSASLQNVSLDEPHIDLESYQKSLEIIRSLPGIVIPGHDRPFAQIDVGLRVGKRIEF